MALKRPKIALKRPKIALNRPKIALKRPKIALKRPKMTLKYLCFPFKSLQNKPKFGIFCMQICQLATLLKSIRVRAPK
jgi:hypothetical protein